MDFDKDMAELKPLAYQVVFDSATKMSTRAACAFLYAVIRLGEVLDWWFPVKNNKII